MAAAYTSATVNVRPSMLIRAEPVNPRPPRYSSAPTAASSFTDEAGQKPS